MARSLADERSPYPSLFGCSSLRKDPPKLPISFEKRTTGYLRAWLRRLHWPCPPYPPHPDARSSEGKACDGEIEPVFDMRQVTQSEYLKQTGRVLNSLWYDLVGTTFNKKFCADWTLYVANYVLPVKAGTTETFPEARSSDTNPASPARTALERTYVM